MSDVPAKVVHPLSVDSETDSEPRSSYRVILKSSAIIGGASFVSILLGVVRTKLLALMLGPSGMGLIGAYTTITDLARTVAGMGLSASGVRQVAEAAATGDQVRIARTASTLRKLCLVLAILGALLLVFSSGPVSRFTFDTTAHAKAITWLSVAVLFGVISGGQTALIQGMRSVADLGKSTFLGAVFGTATSIPLVYFLQEKGIVPYIIAVPLGAMLISWWYSRKIKIPSIAFSWSDALSEGGRMLRLGLVLMTSALLVSAVAYLTRVIIIRDLNVEAAGHYHAAWTLSSLYVGFIIQAMGADFYPRITGLAGNASASSKCLREQIEANLLLGVPGILVTLALAPLIIQLFYSSKFMSAVDLLRWQMLGVLVRMCSWPFGMFIVAKGRNFAFLALEVGFSVLHIVLIWGGMRMFGLPGAGMAFSATCLLYSVAAFLVVRALGAVPFSRGTAVLCGAATVSLLLIMVAQATTNRVAASLIGLTFALLSAAFCARRLIHAVGLQHIARKLGLRRPPA